MKKYSFEGLGYKWERINRKEAKRRYNNEESIAFCPVNLRPGYPYHPEIYACNPDSKTNTFESRENAIIYYNCNPKTGNYLAYFKITKML